MAKISSALVCLCLLVVSGIVNYGLATKEDIGFYELKKGKLSLKVTNYGARIVSVYLPDKYGMFCYIYALI